MNEQPSHQEEGIEAFRNMIHELQAGSDDSRFIGLDVAQLGERERESYQREQAGELSGDELLDLRGDVENTPSQNQFYDYLIKQRFIRK